MRERRRYKKWFDVSPIPNSVRKKVSCTFMNNPGSNCPGFQKEWKALRVTEMNNHLDKHHAEDMAAEYQQNTITTLFGVN